MMETVYFYSSVIGGGLLVLLVLMMLLSGGDADFEADATPDLDGGAADPSTTLFQLSLKTVIAFVTFFGLAGMAANDRGFSTGATLGIAIASGAFAFFMVGYVMQVMMSLQSKGNVDLKKAIGSSAKVDLRIPEKHTGSGKVAVVVGGRLVHRKAVTMGDAIPTGAEVVIDGMPAPDTFEVSPLQ